MRMFWKAYGFLKLRIGWVFIFMTVVAGVVLYLLGKYLEYGTPAGQHSFASEICTGLGTLVLVSGVSGAIMKILAVEGFFLDAVAEDAHGEKGLARLNDAKLHETWLNATRMLHLRNMETDHESAEMKSLIAEMRAQFEKELQSRIPSSEKHFLQWHERTLDIEWLDREKSIVRIIDTVNSELIPFKSEESLSWTASIYSEAGTPITDAIVTELENKLRNCGDEELKLERETVEDGKRILTRFTSLPKPKHEIWRKREWRLNILNDPNFFTISPYIVRRADIRIHNKANGLAVAIIYIGSGKLFSSVSGSRYIRDGESAHIRLDRMMLPEQGYGLTLIKLDAPRLSEGLKLRVE
jgi:hypothetical protein